MKNINLFKFYAFIGTFILFSGSLTAQNAAGEDDATDSYTNNQSWSWSIDDNKNQGPGYFRWFKSGGAYWSDLLMELSNPGGQDSKLQIFKENGSAILQLSANQNDGHAYGNPYLLFQRTNSNNKAAIFVDNNNFLSFSNNSSTPSNKGFRFFNGNGLNYPADVTNPNYGTELMRIGEDGKVNIGPASAQTALNLQITGVGYNQPRFGLSSQHSTWDHYYVTTSDYGPIIRAGGAENGIDFQIGTSSTGTFGDASQNYTSKFQIYPNKIQTKTQEVTFNYGGSADLTKVSINTDKKVDHATLTIAGATYIGTNAEKAATGNLDKFKPEYLVRYNLWVEKGIVTEDLAFADVNSWKDEVFEENYDLKSIEEVQAFIKKNKHLPEVPSEKEIKENGYTAHQMNLIFMQKIEELTLYTIDMNEKLKLLQDEIARLKATGTNKEE